MPNKLSQFWQELKRRKVIRAISVYAASAFVILELLSIIIEPLRLPDWMLQFAIVFLCIGFVMAIILSWIYDIHPDEGIVRTERAQEVKPKDIPKSSNSWKIASYISFVVILILIVVNIFNSKQRSSDIRKLEKSIAVLPFENWHSDEGFAHLGDAIANEINTQLAKISDFHVFAFTSCAKFKGPDKPSISEISEELGANFIIEGSVERQNDNVSIHVQVIRADLDDHIWANEFRGKWKDIFSIRAEIAVSIAKELETVLSAEEIKNIERVPTENPEAYNLVLLGDYLVSKNSPISLREAQNSYEYAISLDQNCIAAYVGLAQCYQFMIRYSLIERKEGNKRAREAVDKALELDKTNGLAYAILGLIKISVYWDIYGPEADFQKAIRYSPNNAWVYASYAQYLRWLGKYDQAIVMAQKASSLDPLTPINNFWLGAILLFSGQYDESISYLLALKDRFPDYAYIYSYLAYNYVFKGDSAKVIYYADRALSFEEYSQFALNLSPLAWAYCKAGNTVKAKEILAEMETSCEQNKEICDPVSFAVVYTGLGDYELAFQYLYKALEIRSGMVPYLRVNGDFTMKEISSDPRYIEILKEIGFRE